MTKMAAMPTQAKNFKKFSGTKKPSILDVFSTRFIQMVNLG